jgi:class 3 adenylate cyclase
MTEAARGSIATILFTDVVDSTAVMQRLGDERAQRVFEQHHRMLAETLAASGGEELQWLGDGQMAAFTSPADAVRCAVAMQQGAGRPIDGERLRIRVGVNVGEIVRGAGGYFGTPVVTARRLCDEAQAGQILCGSIVAELLAGRRAFRFKDLGPQVLKGLADPVGVAEVEYDAEEPRAFLAATPFVGRDEEMARIVGLLHRTQAGEGAKEPNPALVRTLSDETSGNPFFIREVLIHLVEERKLYQRRGAPGDRERALALLDPARRRFEELGMTGWLRRAGRAANELGAPGRS